MRKPFTTGDLAVAAGVLLVSVGQLLWQRESAVSKVTSATIQEQNARIHRTLPAAAGTLTVSAADGLGDLRIELDGSRARVLSAPCRQQICIRTGWLERAGEVAVCVPSHVVLRLHGE
ncbi:uncharacterized protein METZ01_LOCUS401779, partial [marine metagenome]